MADLPLDPEALEAAAAALVDELALTDWYGKHARAVVAAYLAAEPPGVALRRVFTEDELGQVAVGTPDPSGWAKLRSALEGEA